MELRTSSMSTSFTAGRPERATQVRMLGGTIATVTLGCYDALTSITAIGFDGVLGFLSGGHQKFYVSRARSSACRPSLTRRGFGG
jgi:hypothetical protein